MLEHFTSRWLVSLWSQKPIPKVDNFELPNCFNWDNLVSFSPKCLRRPHKRIQNYSVSRKLFPTLQSWVVFCSPAESSIFCGLIRKTQFRGQKAQVRTSLGKMRQRQRGMQISLIHVVQEVLIHRPNSTCFKRGKDQNRNWGRGGHRAGPSQVQELGDATRPKLFLLLFGGSVLVTASESKGQRDQGAGTRTLSRRKKPSNHTHTHIKKKKRTKN